MSFRDWFVLTTACPILIGMGALVTYRVWVRRQDVSSGARAVVGDAGAPGLAVSLLPLTLAFVFAWVGGIASVIWGTGSSPGGITAVVLFVGSIASLLLGFWLWLFMWPKLLIPPHLRGEQGWIRAAMGARGSKGAGEHSRN